MLRKIKRIFVGNKELPQQIPIKEEEYVIIGEDAPAYEIVGSEQIPLTEEKEKEEDREKIEEKVIEKVIKIPPKILTIRIKTPEDFINVREMIEHDIVIVNLEEIPVEGVIKDFLDFKKYLETLGYKLGRVGEYVILAVKDNVNIDRYSPQTIEINERDEE
ncbi:hypothetical protein [Methanotorris igneus]|uniref:Cell division protein SepF n=1 Tax=Methanotorris igneus (strain DSM 5666 / JCM 11834 / Kol 5) TaxID=880724 RepID=F6BEF4_METIK|nr:hypothetical protein [Methanotorris igneus]AEF95615.1 hypothetical protein Metig_0054 [Methanotorris igneus Kol 5]